MKRLRRKSGEDASTLIYFLTKRRGGYRMDRAKRRNTMRPNRAERGRRDNIRNLVRLVDEEMDGVAREQRKKLEAIEAELAESRAFIRSFVKEVAVAPGKATIRYTIPMPQDSPIPGQDAENLTLPSAALPTVSLGTPNLAVLRTFELAVGL